MPFLRFKWRPQSRIKNRQHYSRPPLILKSKQTKKKQLPGGIRVFLLLVSFYSAVVVAIGIWLGEPIRMPERCSLTQTEGVRRLAETMLIALAPHRHRVALWSWRNSLPRQYVPPRWLSRQAAVSTAAACWDQVEKKVLDFAATNGVP